MHWCYFDAVAVSFPVYTMIHVAVGDKALLKDIPDMKVLWLFAGTVLMFACSLEISISFSKTASDERKPSVVMYLLKVINGSILCKEITHKRDPASLLITRQLVWLLLNTF